MAAPLGKAAPANIMADRGAEVWGVLYRITRAELLFLDATEGVPEWRYRQVWIDVDDGGGNGDGTTVTAATYIAEGNPEDGKPSLRYITLLRDGAAAHGLPAQYLDFLNNVEAAA